MKDLLGLPSVGTGGLATLERVNVPLGIPAGSWPVRRGLPNIQFSAVDRVVAWICYAALGLGHPAFEITLRIAA
ncbi:MAG: hypothetical protein OXI87_16880 [Albidovulum sp.]|nr:hypothetical protein [Albidovulum sp.]MDE0306530.1 hypothetical protein [Albidovulum sp.]MDE0531210.1 hypothetical protein [Albidovulum sp.]